MIELPKEYTPSYLSPVDFMSLVERVGRILSDTVGVGEDGDCGVLVHNDTSGGNNIYTFSEMSYSIKYWMSNILVSFYKPSSSEEALLSPHSVLTSFNMRVNLILTLCSRISACVLDSNFLFGGKSRPLCSANSSNSYNKKMY